MKKALPALALFASLALPVSATAADNTVVGVGTGAVAGAVVGGPIGAVVGAVAGGFIGANTPSARTRYRRRARVATRRRAAEQHAPARARFARANSVPASVRPVSARPPARPAAEAPTPAERSGTSWTDPN